MDKLQMIDIDKLADVKNEHVYLSLTKYLEKKKAEWFANYERLEEGIISRGLKNHEEVIGKLLMISVDPDDPMTGYVLMDLGGDLYRISITNPKRVFRGWEESKEIIFFETAGILRIDDEGVPVYHLRYLSESPDDHNKLLTKYILAHVGVIDSEEYTEELKKLNPPRRKYIDEKISDEDLN